MVWKCALLLIATVAIWLAAGRQVTLLLDRLVTVGRTSMPVQPIEYDGGGLRIAGVDMEFGGLNNLRGDIDVVTDPSNRAVLKWGRDGFVLGPRTNPVDGSGRPEILFVPDAGDQIRFIRSRSLLSWPTPFDINWLGGSSPQWKRYVYYQLEWRKASGAKLEMAWRYQQDYYSRKGWTEALMRWNSQTGLLGVRISPAHK